MSIFLKKLIVLMLTMSMLSSCAVVPTFTDKNIPQQCDIFTKEVELDIVSGFLEPTDSCSDEGCVTGLIVMGGFFASSAIISSSIYLIGNTVHYLEKSARCDDKLIKQQVTNFSKEMETNGAKKVEQDNIETIISDDPMFKEPKIKVLKFKELDSTSRFRDKLLRSYNDY